MDSAATSAPSLPSAPSTFSSLPPLAAEISLAIKPWDRATTHKALSSVAYLRKYVGRSLLWRGPLADHPSSCNPSALHFRLLQRPKQKEDLKESLALLLAFTSPALFANWYG
jgi:hypothetical protein